MKDIRCAVVYSSRTGNTKKVAEAVVQALPEGTALYPVEEAPAPDGFDFLALGFWADKGGVDGAMQKYMAQVAGRDMMVGLFGTMGASPESEHGRAIMADARNRVAGNTVLCDFLCMGKIDPKVLKMMEAMRAKGSDNIHPMTPERAASIAEAEKHPNEADMVAARECSAGMIKKAHQGEEAGALA